MNKTAGIHESDRLGHRDEYVHHLPDVAGPILLDGLPWAELHEQVNLLEREPPLDAADSNDLPDGGVVKLRAYKKLIFGLQKEATV